MTNPSPLFAPLIAAFPAFATQLNALMTQIVASQVPPTPVNADLTPYLSQPSPVTLAKGTYTYTGTFVPPAGFHLDGGASEIVVHPAAGALNIFNCQNPNITITNFAQVTGSGNFIHAAADKVTLSNSTINGLDRGLESVIQGTNVTIDSCHILGTNSMGAYIASDNSTVTNNVFDTSVGESPLRYEYTTGKTPPNGAKITGNSFRNHNSTHKGAVQLRVVKNVTFSDNVVDGEIRFGQLASDLVGQAVTPTLCGTGVISNNTFKNPDAGQCPIQIDEGVTVAITGNVFEPTVNTIQVGPVSVAVSSVVTTSKNVQQVLAGQNIKALHAISCAGKQSGDGTDTVVIVKA